ncbi:MAG: hypothetical protein R3F53_21240 [Gammaproteobacteria bacterium]
MVQAAGLATAEQVVDYFLTRLLQVPTGEKLRRQLIDTLQQELGTASIAEAATYMEEPLRLLLHLIMSTPEYQLG